jgi:hypothetical protein
MVTSVARTVIAVLIAAVFGTAGYGYATSNNTPANAGGEASAGVSGFVVDDVSYSLNPADPTRIDAVSFDMDVDLESGGAPPQRARVRLSSTSDIWYSCWPDSEVSPTRFRCPTLAPSTTIAAIDELRVVAATE